MKKILLVIEIFIISAVLGCAADIETIQTHGITKLKTSEEVLAEEMLLKNNMEIVGESCAILWNYNNETTSVKISTKVEGVDSKKIYKGKLTAKSLEYDNLMILFYQTDDYIIAQENDGSTFTIKEINNNKKYDFERKITISPGNLNYIDKRKMIEEYVDGELICQMNIQNFLMEKQELANEVLNVLEMLEINNQEITKIDEYYSATTKLTFYEVFFTTRLGDTRFEDTNARSSDLIKLTGSVVIGESGVGTISGNILFKPYDEINVENLLSVTDILEILPDYIDNYYVNIGDICIDRIKLYYCTKVNKGIPEFFPVWVFQINNSQLSTDTYKINDIIINAITGQIETLD